MKRPLSERNIAMEIINDRYELRSEIRRGGFGVTWYGWDRNLDMPVAVKEFSDPDPEHRSKFLREARTLAQFSGCRGIVNVRDFLETGDKVYMVMEYLDGEDLSTYVDKKGRLSLEETLRLLNPVMDVLSKLHAANMLHRDVSPDNIRLTSDGEVKLLDFGSVSNMTSENLTRTVTVKPGYAPIEQYSGAAEQGPWTDVYSLCATIYKCITGRKPADSLVRSFHDDVELPSALGVQISPGEEAAIMQGFSVQPADRFFSINAFRKALAAAKDASFNAQEKQRTADLAAQAFSDEVTPAQAPAGGTKKGKPAQERPAAASGGGSQEAVSGGGTPGQVPGSGAQAASPSGRIPAPAPAGGRPAGQGQPVPSVGNGASAKRKKGLWLIIPAVLGVVLIAGIAFFFSKRGDGEPGGLPNVVTGVPENATYSSDSTYISFREKEITEGDLAFINSHSKIASVSFFSCVLSDEIIDRMSDMPAVKEVDFYNCEGFSSLDPLADMPALEAISMSLYSDQAFPGNDLFTKDFPKLTKFSLYSGRITGSTEFLRHFPGLTFLVFYVDEDGNDLSFLDVMPALEFIDIKNQTMDEAACAHLYGHPNLMTALFTESHMATLDWAAECASLYKIEAKGSLITDLSPLSGHEELAAVHLSEAPVSDLSPLESCPKLSSLRIDHSEVENLAPLAGHKYLYSLDISYCHVSDLSPLSGLGLEKLRASHNKIASLAPLADCTQMLSINVNGNELSSLEGCEDMIKLTSLSAADNQIRDISAIRNCALLEELQLAKNEISDISALDNDFVELTILDISDNDVSDLSALAVCSKLKAIAADNNKITSISGLEGKPDLGAVLLSGNQVSDLSPLKDSLNTLSYLDVGNNQVSDISVLKDLAVKNVWLLMENNKISDLSALPGLLSYRKLVFYGNPVKDVSFVEKMSNVSSICKFYLSYQSDLDYAAIGESALKYSTVLVDVPSDKKASVLREYKEGSSYLEPAFMTKEEADSEMAQSRKEIRKTVLGESDEAEEEMSN